MCCNQISVCTQSPKCTEPLISFFKEVLVVLHHSLSLDQKLLIFLQLAAAGGNDEAKIDHHSDVIIRNHDFVNYLSQGSSASIPVVKRFQYILS